MNLNEKPDLPICRDVGHVLYLCTIYRNLHAKSDDSSSDSDWVWRVHTDRNVLKMWGYTLWELSLVSIVYALEICIVICYWLSLNLVAHRVSTVPCPPCVFLRRNDAILKPHWGTYNITCTSLQFASCSRLKKIAQLVPPPVIARGWSTNSRIIISLAWQTVAPPAHPRATMLCCCFYCWLDCWALKRFATENFSRFTVASSTLHPRAATSTSSRVLTSTPTTTTTSLSASSPSAALSPTGQVHFEFTFAFALPTSKVVFIVAAFAVFITLTVCHAHTQAHGEAASHLPHRPVA